MTSEPSVSRRHPAAPGHPPTGGSRRAVRSARGRGYPTSPSRPAAQYRRAVSCLRYCAVRGSSGPISSRMSTNCWRASSSVLTVSSSAVELRVVVVVRDAGRAGRRRPPCGCGRSRGSVPAAPAPRRRGPARPGCRRGRRSTSSLPGLERRAPGAGWPRRRPRSSALISSASSVGQRTRRRTARPRARDRHRRTRRPPGRPASRTRRGSTAPGTPG